MDTCRFNENNWCVTHLGGRQHNECTKITSVHPQERPETDVFAAGYYAGWAAAVEAKEHDARAAYQTWEETRSKV